MKLGGRLAAVRQKFNDQEVRDTLWSGTVPSEQQLWRQIGPYTFAAQQFKEGKESTGYTSISLASGVIKLGSMTLAPNVPEHTCVSKLYGPAWLSYVCCFGVGALLSSPGLPEDPRRTSSSSSCQLKGLAAEAVCLDKVQKMSLKTFSFQAGQALQDWPRAGAAHGPED